MLDSVISPLYEKLKERKSKYDKYAKPSHLILKSIFIPLALYFVSPFLDILVLHDDVFVYSLFVAVAWITFAVISVYLLNRKARVYGFNVDEGVVFYACAVLEDLDNYSHNDRPELKKHYKKNAVINTRNLLSTIENGWTVGDFELARRAFGKSISDFKANLRSKIIPGIEQGDEKNLKAIEGIVYSLVYTKSVDGLQHLNESVSKLDSYAPSNASFLGKCANFLRLHGVLRHFLVTIGLVSVGLSVYYLGVNYGEISKDVAFATGASLSGILVAGYWQYVKKEKGK